MTLAAPTQMYQIERVLTRYNIKNKWYLKLIDENKEHFYQEYGDDEFEAIDLGTGERHRFKVVRFLKSSNVPVVYDF
ncbi:hypothetical protein FRX31_014231 [Thalictrum thalictroides]|uniref:Uncharacterized protein n=1 Tax=Thalictrum thalictroides TaxID=46969 RepID=A0A7J6WJ99_THATH|nr:hypothetical protein FRX31_014231 [Thalictrum thalictroides]